MPVISVLAGPSGGLATHGAIAVQSDVTPELVVRRFLQPNG